MKTLLTLVIASILTSFSGLASAAKAPVPLLKDRGAVFQHMKVLKQYRVTYQFMDVRGVIALKRAVQVWNNTVHKNFIVLTNEDVNVSVSKVEMPHGLMGLAIPFTNGQCTILLSRGGSYNYSIIMHELGHCFGLAHQDETPLNCGKLMHPRPDCIYRFREVDRPTTRYLKKARKSKKY